MPARGCPASTSPGPTRKSSAACSPAVNATACTWPSRLDEPTNDVDVNTIRALEEGLENFAGCAVVVSHDRWFLDRIATHILAYEGDGKVVFFEGNYQEYEENRKLRLGPDAQPKRFKYKKLME